MLTSSRPPSPRGTIQKRLLLLHPGAVVFGSGQPTTAPGGIGHVLAPPATSVPTDPAVAPRIWQACDPTDLTILGFAGTGADDATITARVWIARQLGSLQNLADGDEYAEFVASFAFDLNITLSTVQVPAGSRYLPAGVRYADTLAIVGSDETLPPGVRIIHDAANGGQALLCFDRLNALGVIVEPKLGTATGAYVFGSEA